MTLLKPPDVVANGALAGAIQITPNQISLASFLLLLLGAPLYMLGNYPPPHGVGWLAGSACLNHR